jgi:hypothetical protein
VNEILDLLPIPPERDFPAGQLEVRRGALVAATRVEAARPPVARRVMRGARGYLTKTWLSLLGILALGIALVVTGVSGQQRPAQSGAVALLAVAGAAAAVAPGDGLRRSFDLL